MSWTPERESKLRALWKEGRTASQIAALLGDTTRNAVIGKAHRLNLEARTVSKKSSTATKAKFPSSEKTSAMRGVDESICGAGRMVVDHRGKIPKFLWG